MASYTNDWHCDEERCGMFGFCAASGVQQSTAGGSALPERCLLPVNQQHARLEEGCPDIEELEMKAKSWRWFCSLMMLFGVLLGAFMPGDGKVWAKEDGSLAAVVNGAEISRDEFKSELERVQRQQGIKGKLADESKFAELQREALENLITRELLYQESINRKIAVPPGAVEKQLSELAGEFSSEAQFVQTLARMGTDREKLREQIRRGLAVRALVDATISARITVSDDEAKSYYYEHREGFATPPQVHLAHILVALDPAWPKERKAAAREKIEGLRKRLQSGEKLAALAAESSDCQSKKNGGDIGWFSPGQLAPSVEKAVGLLKVGQLSDVVEDRIGYHLIRVLERKVASTPSFEEVADKARGFVKKEKGFRELQTFVQRLRDGAKVEIYLAAE